MNYFITLLLIFTGIHSAHALESYYPTAIHQGSTMELLFPANDITALSGTLDGKAINFYQITQTPRDYDRISRGEFMELLMDNGDFAPVTGSGTLFPDVQAEDLYAEAIYEASDLGFISGYADGNFYPYHTLTRAQAAKMLMNAFHPPLVLEQPPAFTDLPTSHSLAGFMGQAIQARLFQGYGDGTIKPDRYLNITEAEILLQRASGKEELLPRQTRSYWRGYVGLHRINDIGTKTLLLTATRKDGTVENVQEDITVLPTKYPTTSFSLPPSKTALFNNDKYNATWAMIDGAKKTTHPQQLWEGPFIVPTEGRISMGFGNTVYINGTLSGSHFGIDYANKTGTPIYASNHGVVVLAADTPSYGNTVIIDHGHNVFTMYMHMDKIHTSKGITVRKGDLIGDIGMTGIATGPHLHFNHFIGNVIVDSNEWF